MGDDDMVSADAGTDDAADAVVAGDVAEVARRPAGEQGGGGDDPFVVVGPFRGSGATFEVLTDVDGSIVVKVVGQLDLSTVPGLDAAVRRVLSGGGRRLVVDASGLEFADSSAIALWVRWTKEAGPIEIRDPQQLLRSRIWRMGLAERLRLTP